MCNYECSYPINVFRYIFLLGGKNVNIIVEKYAQCNIEYADSMNRPTKYIAMIESYHVYIYI